MNGSLIASIAVLAFIVVVFFGAINQQREHNKNADAPKRSVWAGGTFIILLTVGAVVFGGLQVAQWGGGLVQSAFNDVDPQMPQIGEGIFSGGGTVDAPNTNGR